MTTHVVLRKFIAILLRLIAGPFIILTELANNFYHWYHLKDLVEDIGQKAVLITGCDSGFGHNAALHFAERGAKVFAGCMTPEGIADLTNRDVGIQAFQLDITKKESVTAAKGFVQNSCRADNLEFWGVVSNAGIGAPAQVPVEWLSYEEIKRVIDVNQLGHILTAMTFLPLIKASKGRVAFVASVGGYINAPAMAPYVSSKYGIRAFAEVLRQEMATFGVRVSIIAPEFYQTNITKTATTTKTLEERWGSLSEDLKQDYPLAPMKTAAAKKAVGMEKNFARNRIEDVSEVYFDAVFASRPRSVYFVGAATPIVQLLSIMPDYMAGFIYGLKSS